RAARAAPHLFPTRRSSDLQQASLFGHRCFSAGSFKNTYGTGCFLLRNIGTRYSPPPKGLLGTVAWTLGGKTTYAHEGAVMIGGRSEEHTSELQSREKLVCR